MKGRRMSITWVVILLTGVVMLTGCGLRKSVKEIQTDDLGENDTEVVAEKPIEEECETYFADASYITVEKVQRKTVEDEQGNSDTQYDTYYVSDVDLIKKTDETGDYTKCLKSQDFDDAKVDTVAFPEAYGFSYEDKNGWDIFETLLQSNGIKPVLSDGEFVQDIYETSHRKVFYMKDQEEVFQRLLEGEEYEEIEDASVFYQTTQTKRGVCVPESVTAVVVYQKGEETITKSLFLQVTVNEWSNREE